MKKELTRLNVKELAVLYCKEIERGRFGEKRLYTDKDFNACLDTQYKRRKFCEWCEYFSVILDNLFEFGTAYGEYMEAVNAVIGYLRLLESYQQEEAHLNAIYEQLKALRSDEALPVYGENAQSIYRATAIEAMRKVVKNSTFALAEAKIGEDGYIVVDCSPLFSLIDKDIKHLTRRLRSLKSIIIGVEAWAELNNCKEFIPTAVQEYIEKAKSDLSLTIAPLYSRKELHRREQEGVKIMPTERKCAVFPYYEEIEHDARVADSWTQMLQDSYAERLNKVRIFLREQFG